MQLMLISGSRNPSGQTARAAAAILEGAAGAGCATAQVLLPTVRLERCRQCEEHGWGLCRREGRCVIEDDFAGIVDRMRAADVILFATPVYYSDLSESLRAFTDRLRRICTQAAGRTGVAGKPAAGLCVAGGGGGGAPECCVRLERVLQHSGLDVVDLIPIRRQNLAAKLTGLRSIGAWLATAPRSGE